MSDEFLSRLETAIQRGKHRAEAKNVRARRAELTEEELRGMHSNFRLTLTERIERAVGQVADHFPGFRLESVLGESGWGTACYRDDLTIEQGKRKTQYSRFEIVVRPFSDVRVLDVKAKGTILNRELVRRGHFVPIDEVDIEEFMELIETWSIEFAELYATRTELKG